MHAITDLEQLPVVLTLDEIVAVYRRGKSTIQRELQAGSFRPVPFAKFPYRWLRDDVKKDLQRRSVLEENTSRVGVRPRRRA